METSVESHKELHVYSRGLMPQNRHSPVGRSGDKQGYQLHVHGFLHQVAKSSRVTWPVEDLCEDIVHITNFDVIIAPGHLKT